jgi:hypothetical protein
MDGRDRMTDLQKTIMQIYQGHYANTDYALNVSALHNALIDKGFNVSKYKLKKQLAELKKQELIYIDFLVDDDGKIWGRGYFLTGKGKYFEV